MYSIYADGKCIYSDISAVPELRVINPELTMEDNSAGSLTFTLPPENPGYDAIQRMTTEVVVMRHNEEIWAGRVFDEEIDFYNCRKIYCEGELAYLNDTIQPPAEYHNMTVRGMLEKFIEIHNQYSPDSHKFKIGSVTVEDPNDSLYRYTNYESTMDCLKGKLLDPLGGHIRVRKFNGERYIDYLKDYPNVTTQKIEFGKNLLDFTKNYTMDDFITVLVPMGTSISCSDYDSSMQYYVDDYVIYEENIYRCTVQTPEDGEDWNKDHWTYVQKSIEALTPYLTVAEVNEGSIYVVNQEAVNTYGWIVGTHTWSDVTQASNLLTKAQNYLSEIQFDRMELELTAVDLHYMDVEIESLDLLDKVRVISRPHGLDRLFPVRKVSIPLDKPENTTFTLSDKEEGTTGLAASTNKINTEILDKIDNMTSDSQLLQMAKDNATSLINMSTNGFVTIVKGQNGTSELLITDEKDYKKAKKVWRWNVNGLGYSNNGYLGPYGLAMTMDGSIVADRITTGKLSTDRLSGAIRADSDVTITWSKVTEQPTIPTNTNQLVNGAGFVDANAATVISNNAITTATINCNQLNGGTITSQNIYGGRIEGAELWANSGQFYITDIRPNNSNGVSIEGDCIINGDFYIASGTNRNCFIYNYATFHNDQKARDGHADSGMSGHAWGTVWSYNYETVSDRNKKCDIDDLDEELFDVLMELTPRQYRFKKEYAKNYEDLHMGFIAQEVGDVFENHGVNPDDYALYTKTTYEDDDGETKTTYNLNYTELIALNTKAIQKMHKEIEDLKAEIKALKGEN